VLGDLAYIARLHRPHMIPAIKRQAGQVLRAEEKAFNDVHGFYRATVEHVFGFLKRFQIFGGRFRGVVRAPKSVVDNMKSTGRDDAFKDYVPFLTNAVKVIIHISNIHLKLSPKRTVMPIPPAQLADIFARRRRDEEERRRLERIRIQQRDYFDPVAGTGLTINNFLRGERVHVFHQGEWFHAKVVYLTVRTQRLTVRYTGHNFDTAGVDPRTVRHAPVNDS